MLGPLSLFAPFTHEDGEICSVEDYHILRISATVIFLGFAIVFNYMTSFLGKQLLFAAVTYQSHKFS